jgi:hypothetical protein
MRYFAFGTGYISIFQHWRHFTIVAITNHFSIQVLRSNIDSPRPDLKLCQMSGPVRRITADPGCYTDFMAYRSGCRKLDSLIVDLPLQYRQLVRRGLPVCRCQ